MRALDTTLLSQACRIFLSLAYPDGESSIPLPRRALLRRRWLSLASKAAVKASAANA